MKHSELKSLLRKEILNEMGLNEMATFYKIKSGKEEEAKTALNKAKEKYREGTTLYNTLDILSKSGQIDYKELAKQTGKDIATWNNPKSREVLEKELADYIEIEKKEKSTKPTPEKKEGTGQRGRPKGPEKKKDSKATTFKLSKSYTASDEDEPTDLELRKLARSADPITGSQTQQLRQQEARKMWRAWSREMEKKGIVDSANRILDKARFDEERAKKAPEIKAAIDKLF